MQPTGSSQKQKRNVEKDHEMSNQICCHIKLPLVSAHYVALWKYIKIQFLKMKLLITDVFNIKAENANFDVPTLSCGIKDGMYASWIIYNFYIKNNQIYFINNTLLCISMKLMKC